MGQQTYENKILQGLYRFIDIKQPEVKWAFGTSTLIVVFFRIISLYSNFTFYENDICNLIQCIIAGLISLIGVAIAGIAIVIALFSAEQIKIIDKLQPKTFDRLLYDFKWLALVSTVEIAIFTVIYFVIRSPYPIVHKLIFYFIVFLLLYGVFYLLFYGYALIGNFIKLSRIKCSLDTALAYSKDIPVSAIEMQLDFLVSKLLHQNKETSYKFYTELIEILENSPQKDKTEIIDYLKKRYINPN